MALDPKQVIQKNIPLVVCYVVAIVPVVLWIVMVVNGVQGGATGSYKQVAGQLRQKKTGLDKIEKDIKADPGSVFTPEHKRKFQERNTELDAQYTSMIKLVQDRDNALELWFRDFADQAKDKLPGTNAFQNVLNRELDVLKKDYKEIVEDPSPNKTLFIALEPVAEGTQRKIQKQFWILQRVLEALKKGGTATAADPAPIRLVQQIEFPNVPPPSTGPGQQKPMMTAIPVKIVAQMGFRDVPKVCRELLARDIVFRVKAVHTEMLPFTISKPAVNLMVNPDPRPLYEQTIYNATLANEEGRPTDEEQWFPEPKLRVTIELEAVDFDMEAISATPAPPPVAEQPKQEEPPPPPPRKKPKKEE